MTVEIPVVVVGAGAMGRHWIRTLRSGSDLRVVGIVDLDVSLARRAALDEGYSDIAVGVDLRDVVSRSGAQAVVNVTVPQAHRPVNEQALRLGLPVLCEKPLAPSLAEAIQQVALANVTGQLLMVSQSRRYFSRLKALRELAREVGALDTVTQQYFHADHEPGFREQMAHPLLVDMSIHHFDACRFVTQDEPVSVQCTTWNPSWSWFRGDASATADFELGSGAHFIYAGSRCAPGAPTSWNADWRVQGEDGTATWDGDARLTLNGRAIESVPTSEEDVAGAAADFVHALRTASTPSTEVRLNIMSLAMVEAAIASSDRGGLRVHLAELLEDAYVHAVQTETAEDVRNELLSWSDLSAGISTKHWGQPALAHSSQGVVA